MKIDEVKTLLESFVDETIVNFQIDKTIFDSESGREAFNRTVRQYVGKKFGVYIWVDKATDEIVYIGMAGKIKTDGTLGDHSIQSRLLASRGKDKITKKDIQTNDYIRELMTQNNINSFDFYVMYSKAGEPPAYIEALLLYKYYKKNNRLPRFNNAF
ncbi:hypothetical protein [Spirosoma sordidisoli]|uniref:GIY-YIG nuclease family protein n=1 Tax=Spirosoma sordidisoli TaxID=2502893 RepID=A0A4Q2UTJ3_9BACT|nr:hypothetical protein [Spirosoma sordidisoli]RYC71261.1 hypothetical protein EQG79_03700 [Spirosoma sordidisoli]